jgi:hypothetical protein
LGCSLLLPEFGDLVSGILRNKHDRAKANAQNDVTKAFFETIYEGNYSDPMFIADHPNDEYGMHWDPNNINRIDIARAAEWMTDTWTKYLHKKYRGALRKWNEETVDGDGTAPIFFKFCCKDTWLLCILCINTDMGHLLSHMCSKTC